MSDIINSLSGSIQEKLKKYYFNEFQKSGACSTAPTPAANKKEPFLEGAVADMIEAENEILLNAADEYYHKTYANESLVKYQNDIYDSLTFLNTILLMLYILLLLYILAMLLKQYLYNAQRNIYYDLFAIIAMILYPILMSTIEIYIYRFIKYLGNGLVVFGYAFLRLFQFNI